MDRQYTYKTREITATPRNKRIADVVKTVVSSGISEGGATVPQYWELVTVAADGSALAQEDYYLRPRQDLNVVSQRNLIAYGDVIAKSVDEEIEDAELPKAGYGITNFGLTAIKQGGGLLVDSNNLVYIDPNYAGGGGLDIEQLEAYLKSNGYLKLHDPATSLLMTGYVKAGAYSPILATDNLSVAVGKLEKHFDDYVTLATAQTITGAKIFTQDIIGQGDIIAKSTSEAISDAELPIASKTQLGLIKIGTGFDITADGTINNAGGGGLTEVYWDDIKNPPKTLAGYGITDALGKNETAAAASKLSPGCKIWGQAFTGEKDITGTLSSVGGIQFVATNAFNIDGYGNFKAESDSDTNVWGVKNYSGGRALAIYASSGNVNIGNNALYVQFGGNSGFGTSSPQAKLHVVGNGLFTGEVRSTSSKPFRSVFGDYGFFILRDSYSVYFMLTNSGDQYGSYSSLRPFAIDVNTGNVNIGNVALYVKHGGNTGFGTNDPKAKIHVVGDGLFTGDVIAKSTSEAISDAELPIASASTLGLIKVGSTLRISNGVLDVAGGSGGGGSIVTWGTTSNGVARLTVDGVGKDVSLSGHTHSQYLTSHQAIYKLTIQKNGVTVGTYTPNVGTATINITTSGSGGGWASGTYTDNGVCLVNNNGGGGLAFWNDTEKTGLRVGGGNGIKGYNDTYGHLGNLFFNYVSSSVNVKVDAYGKIYSNGTALSSDLRLKEVVGYEFDVLERMTKIPVIKFYRKDVGDNVQTTGFGAQSFQGIFDNVTIFNKDSGYYMISETSILGITFQGVKELYAMQKQTTNEIDALKRRVALLEAENQNLWNLINEKEAA